MPTEVYIPAKWYELMLFQFNISKRWYKRGNESTAMTFQLTHNRVYPILLPTQDAYPDPYTVSSQQ